MPSLWEPLTWLLARSGEPLDAAIHKPSEFMKVHEIEVLHDDTYHNRVDRHAHKQPGGKNDHLADVQKYWPETFRSDSDPTQK